MTLSTKRKFLKTGSSMIGPIIFNNYKSKKEAGKPKYIGSMSMIRGKMYMFDGKKWVKLQE